MKCPYVMKKCSKCGEIKHISKYSKKKGCKYNVSSRCKICDKKYKEEHKEEIQEYNKQYFKNHKEERLEYKRNCYKNDRNYREKCKTKSKKYYQLHKHDKDYINKKKKYRLKNPHIRFNEINNRRKAEEKGNGVSKEQWKEMMDFFEWKCAYSGKRLTRDNKSVDHIVALYNDGENEVWNCVPMYKNYNSSKQTSDMLEWYIKQEYFDINRLTKIYEWRIYAYEKWGKEMV